MQVFVIAIRLPQSAWEERKIISAQEVPESLLFWNSRELGNFLSGEFNWELRGRNLGICAIQYINRYTVRFLIKASDKELAKSLAIDASRSLDVKKFNKRKYGSRQSKNTQSYTTR